MIAHLFYHQSLYQIVDTSFPIISCLAFFNISIYVSLNEMIVSFQAFLDHLMFITDIVWEFCFISFTLKTYVSPHFNFASMIFYSHVHLTNVQFLGHFCLILYFQCKGIYGYCDESLQ